MLRRLVTSNRQRAVRPPDLYCREFQRFLGRTLSATERVVISALERQRLRGRPRPIMVIDRDKNDSTRILNEYLRYRLATSPDDATAHQHHPALSKNPNKNSASKTYHLPSGRLPPRLHPLIHSDDRRAGRLLILPIPKAPRRLPASMPRPIPHTLRRGLHRHTHARRHSTRARPRHRRM